MSNDQNCVPLVACKIITNILPKKTQTILVGKNTNQDKSEVTLAKKKSVALNDERVRMEY